jgi:hypothetical protein
MLDGFATCWDAAYYGHGEVVEWLREHYPNL